MNDKEKPPELLPCPWCGVQPWYGEFPRRDIASERHEIACEHPDCPVRAEVYGGSKEEVTAKWNTRADLVPADVWDEAIAILNEYELRDEQIANRGDAAHNTALAWVRKRFEAARDKAKGTKP